jgi:hypothetical protein
MTTWMDAGASSYIPSRLWNRDNVSKGTATSYQFVDPSPRYRGFCLTPEPLGRKPCPAGKTPDLGPFCSRLRSCLQQKGQIGESRFFDCQSRRLR